MKRLAKITVSERSHDPTIYLLRADRKPKERSIIATFPRTTHPQFIKGWADAKGFTTIENEKA